MMAKDNFKPDADDQTSLSKRYLFWLYKMTRDELDRIDRKFTQLDIDNEIHKKIKKGIKGFKGNISGDLEVLAREWQEYIFQKESDAQKLKYIEAGHPNPNYLFLRLKLKAIEEITVKRFGKKQLECCKKLYEEAAMKMILEDTSGRR